MPYRTMKFVLSVFIGFLLAVTLTFSGNESRAAEDCLSGPKGATPPGGHWRYRIDRATKRHCWYVANQPKLASDTGPRDRVSSEKAQVPVTVTTKQVADARAEIPPPQNSMRRPKAYANSTTSNPVDGSQVISTGRWTGADRWPDQPAQTQVDDTPSRTVASTSSNPPESLRPETPSARTTGGLAVANLPTDTSTNPLRFLFGAIVGALVIAGAISGLIYTLSSARRTGSKNVGGRRRVNWDAVAVNSVRPSALDGVRAFVQRLYPRPAQSKVENTYRDIEEILSRVSQRRTT
jgi:hypothetical protein